MKISSLRVGQRIGLAFGVLLLLLLIVAVTAIVKLGSLNHEAELLAEDRVPKLEKSSEWALSILQSARHSRNTLILEGMDRIKPETESMIKERAVRGEVIKWLEERVITPAGKQALGDLKDTRAKYSAAEDKFIALVLAEKFTEARALLLGEVRPLQLDYLKGINVFVESQRGLVREQARAAKDSYRSGLLITGVLSAIALLVAMIAGWVLARSITRQLGGEPDYATNVAREIAEGNLTVNVQTSAGNDASLLAAMKAMRDSLAGVVSTVRQGSESVATASSQIAQGNQDLSARTESQASALEETAASMEELGSTVKQNADNAKQANQLAQSASKVAVQGGEVVAQVVGTMKGISESSKKIADIINVIDGIAFQTNILALNAAVEAARAGEQGRGFAVVASEVRSLAGRSAEAAKEIKTLITDSVTRVDQGSALVDQAGTTMNEVVASIRRVTDIMGEISAASTEQSQGVAQIGEAVMQMDQVTQQNAALVEEMAAAANSLRGQAGELVQAVAVFKLGQGGEYAAARPAAAVVHAPAAKSVARPAPRAAARPALGSNPAPTAKAKEADGGDWESF